LLVDGVVNGILPAHFDAIQLIIKNQVLKFAQHHHQLEAEHLLPQLIVAPQLGDRPHSDLKGPHAVFAYKLNLEYFKDTLKVITYPRTMEQTMKGMKKYMTWWYS